MKKKFYIFAALLAIAAVSCQKEQLKPENEPVEETPGTEIGEVPEGSVVFTASIAPGKTRTVIGEAEGGDYQPLWTDSDKIIVNNVLSTKTVVLNDGQSARFTVPGVSAPYHVLSPGNKFGQDILTYDEEAGTYRYLINGAASPHVYTTNGEYPTYPANMAVIAAYGATEDDVDLQFRHLSVYFKITVDAEYSTDAENIRYIYVRQGLNEGVSALTAGYWTATYTDADHITQVPSNLSSAITLSCGGDGVAHGTPMIIAVPVYDYPDGLIITLKDVSGHFASYVIDSGKTQFATDGAAGTIFDFTPKFSPGPGTISNAGDWEAFARELNSGKDFDVFRWVGNGTVKLGDDLSGENFAKITTDFPYIFDGQDNTIERTKGKGALFFKMSGTVKNLKLEGTIESTDNRVSALVDSLYYGAKIEYCDNDVAITTSGSYGIVGGLAAVMTGGTISHCNNTGDITVHVDCSTEDKYHLQAGGIVGTINNTLSQKHGDATVEYCTNSGAITCDPICTATDVTNSTSYGGIWNTNVGGIVASARGTNHKITIDNCSNGGNVTLSGDNVKDDDGLKYNTIFAGGILGSAVEMVQYTTPTRSFYMNPASGLDISVTDCTNTGTVRNCGANNASGIQNMRKVFTGGIAGSVFGTSTKYATLSGCLNEGKVLTYDIASGDTVDEVALTPFKYTIRNQVAGGLLGAAGYVEIDDCDVNCEIGNGRRMSFSAGGAIGLAFRAFNIHDCTVWTTSRIVRNQAYVKFNSAVLAVVPLKYASSSMTQGNLPDITGAVVKNNKGGMDFYNKSLTETDSDIDDQSASGFTKNTLKTATMTGHFVRGTQGNSSASAATATSLGILAEDWDGNTGISSYPTP